MKTRKLITGFQDWNKVIGNAGRFIVVGLIVCFTSNITFAQKAKKIGKVNDFKESLSPEVSAFSKSSKKRLAAADGSLDVTINVTKVKDGRETFIGEVKGSKSSSVFFHFKDGKVEGKAILPHEKKAYTYSTDENGDVVVESADINKLVCVEYEKAPAPAAVASSAPPAGSSVYNLQSFAGATAVVKLDFDGEYITSSSWNGGNPIDAQPYDITEEGVVQIWKMISEDFKAFNINITTSEAVYQAAPANRRMKCIFTPTNFYSSSAGGVAYIGSFTWGDNTPCWAFNGGVKAGGETGSHEIGHTLGLNHDGRTNPSEEYYAGISPGWAPIMGVGFYGDPVQWSKGEYNFANNTEDDIAIIAGTTNGFGFRTDEAGDAISNAKQLIYSASGEVVATSNTGIISSRTDVDVYYFGTNGGTATINVRPAALYPDLDVLLTLKNSAGAVIATANPLDSMSATISANLSAGNYYIVIDGTGNGDPATSGYSDYSSIGEYSISGSLMQANTAPTVSIITPANNAQYAAPASFEISANATDLEGPISKVEFYQDNVKIGEDAFYPGFGWNVSNLPAGIYSFTAKAFDQQGLSSTSSPVTVVVKGPNTPPSVSFITPTNKSQFSAPATFELSVNATDNDGPIAKVEFYQNGVKIGEDAFYPGFGLTVSNLPIGTYVFTAKAYDQEGLSTVSAPDTVIVHANTPPSVSFITPANNAQFTAPASFDLSVSVTDQEGPISKVEFYQNGVKIGEDAFYPSFGWGITNLYEGTYTYTAKAFDQEGLTTISAPITVVVNPSPCILTEPTPAAAQYVLRNSWYDQQSGSTVSNESGALKIVQRVYGQNELWVIETGKTFSITSGQTYNVKFDFLDYYAVNVAGVDVAFANGVMANGSGPQLVQAAVAASSGYSSAHYTTKSVNITSSYTGTVSLAFRIRWNAQPTYQVTNYMQNIFVCPGAGTPSREASSSTELESSAMFINPNPSTAEFYSIAQKEIEILYVTNTQGSEVYSAAHLEKGSSLQFGREFSAGIYFVSVIYRDGSRETFKLIKN